MSDQYFYKQQRHNRQKLDWKCLFRKKSDPGRPQSLQRKVNYYMNKRLQCFFAELLATGLYVMIGDGATSQVIIGRYLSGTMLNQTGLRPDSPLCMRIVLYCTFPFSDGSEPRRLFIVRQFHLDVLGLWVWIGRRHGHCRRNQWRTH